VEYEDASSAEKAQRALDGHDFGGRSLRVNEAHERGSGGGGGGGGGRRRM
jgi:RNA recognition motif-containing protein